jgi:hypothetical protein
MKIIRILILEDDLETLSKIFDRLAKLENKYSEENFPVDFSTIVLSEYTQVEEYINKNTKFNYDLILLDRDCKIGGSFHILDIKKSGTNKIIGISSVPNYNEELHRLGVTKIVRKNYAALDDFADKISDIIGDLVNKV